MIFTGTEKEIIQRAPFQLRPEETQSNRIYYAIRRLHLLGYIQLSFKSQLSRRMKIPTVELTFSGQIVAPPTVEGK